MVQPAYGPRLVHPFTFAAGVPALDDRRRRPLAIDQRQPQTGLDEPPSGSDPKAGTVGTVRQARQANAGGGVQEFLAMLSGEGVGQNRIEHAFSIRCDADEISPQFQE